MPYISDEPTFELVRQGTPSGIEVVVEGISVQIGHTRHVEIRKPRNSLDDALDRIITCHGTFNHL